MCSTTSDAGRVHQHAKTVLSASISAAAIPGEATSDDIYRLLIQNRGLLLALSETAISRASTVEGEPNDKPLRTTEAIEQAGLSKTAFDDLRNPKHENFDESFPTPFDLGSGQRFWKNEIRAWVKAKAAQSRNTAKGASYEL
ncbi:hypothetical protein [Rhodanobacter sp. DHG33]|uniref:helix-turn-helix transcriptional regulator n=1 Tax=Rhodanobacter sp. DHG33 TaxID=2775921 RepID=UPI00177F236F|nr:hypothetical protein [Rhodanobacter sp. DHG33]MBD8898479.1 hypothetical protein [Rhodanobacter sp. DHG33]